MFCAWRKVGYDGFVLGDVAGCVGRVAVSYDCLPVADRRHTNIEILVDKAPRIVCWSI